MTRSFYALWSGYLITQVGNWLYLIALPLIIYDLTGSPFYMASIFAVEFLPWLLFSIFGGLLADMFDKKKLILIGNLTSALFIGLLTLIISLPNLQMPLVYVTVFALSSINPLTHPAFNSIIPQLVEKRNLVKANSAIQLIENTITLMGPMVGGGVIAIMGGTNALLIDAICFLLAVVLFLFIKTDPSHQKEKVSRNIKMELSTGLSYTFSNKVVLYGSFLFFFTNFAINAFQSNYLYYLVEILQLDSKMIGLTIVSLVTFIDGEFGTDSDGDFLFSPPPMSVANGALSFFRLRKAKNLLTEQVF